LSGMRGRGLLDQALVAHYASVRDPARLFGFTEHVLGLEAEPGDANWQAAA